MKDKRKRFILRASVLGIILVALVGAFASAYFNDDSPVRVGEAAPNFTLETVDEEQVSLSDYEGKGVYMSFWATWCDQCELETPIKQKLHEEKMDDGIEIISVNVAEGRLPVSRYIDDYDLTYTNVLDQDRAVTRQYGVANLPASFFINPEGELEATHVGRLTEDQMRNYLAKIQP